MALSAELLETLHRIHRQLDDLRSRADRGPRQVRAREASVAKLQEDHATAQESVKQLKLAADRKQLELKSSEAKVVDWKVKLNACSSNKEFQALRDQIAAAEMAGSVLADEILETMEKSDQLEVAVGQAKEKVDVAKGELAKFRDVVVQEGQLIAADIKRLEGELATEEANLPNEHREDYRRVIRGKGSDGLASAEGGVCGGCGQQITLNMQNELLLAKPVYCKACGRLLYAPPR